MSIEFNYYKNNFFGSFAAEVGFFGQHCVEERLAKLGWRLSKPKKAGNEVSSLYDYDAFYKNSSGKRVHRLIEVKAKKAFNYSFGKFELLQVDTSSCDDYDDIIEKLHCPMDLFWIDFRNRKTYMKDFKTLLIRTEIRGKMFPFYEEYENIEPSLFFAADQFEQMGDITDAEYKIFLNICEKYNVNPNPEKSYKKPE